ncbi:MAG TPA: hypothetical protein VFG04_30735 [Planctomycetaceae bacterium]|nr:hypothetical protein [Planctomycetaceae bacterium]
MTRNCLVLVAILCLMQSTAAIADKGKTAAPRVTLTADERQLLDGVFKQGLFDPTGAERVRVKTSVRTVFGVSRETVREAWFRKGTGKAPGTLVFVDGEERRVSDRRTIETVDFIATCRLRFPKLVPAPPEGKRRGPLRDRRPSKPVEEIDNSPLVLAAWLYRLGHEDLAVRALSQSLSEGRETFGAAAELQGGRIDVEWWTRACRSELAHVAFEEMVHAFMVAADDEALAAGERLVRLYPDESKQFRQSTSILNDLRRRKSAGTFGRIRTQQWPAAFKTWDGRKQTDYLIDSLDQIGGRPFSMGGVANLVEDASVMALARIGDSAVPALIAVIEKDTRLTRTVQYWEGISTEPTVVTVREAALDALMSITGTPFVDPNSIDDSFSRQSDAQVRQVAARIQVYWDRYGRMPFDERMMRILTEPTSDFESKRQAATNLAHLGETRLLGFSQMRVEASSNDRRRPPHAAIKKFKNPTIASAILAAFDADLKHFNSQPHQDFGEFQRRGIEDGYMQSLIDLGDTTIAPELTQRAASSWQLRERQLFANAACQLGAPGAMRAFAKQIERAGFALPADKPDTEAQWQPGAIALSSIVEDLVRMKSPEADRALFAISDPTHPYYATACSRITAGDQGYGDRGWLSHPYCLKILRSELDNQERTGGNYRRQGARVILTIRQQGNSFTSDIPVPFVDPKMLKDAADERRCDRAALKLNLLVYGFAPYHPLAKDADARLKEFKRVFDGFRDGFRLATQLEIQFLELPYGECWFLPEWKPLSRPATQVDVTAGRAVFQLNGTGKVAPLKLPAVASAARSLPFFPVISRPKLLLIVQAEIDAKGKTVYGVIGAGAPRRVRPDELTDIKPIRKSFFDFLR